MRDDATGPKQMPEKLLELLETLARFTSTFCRKTIASSDDVAKGSNESTVGDSKTLKSAMSRSRHLLAGRDE